MNWSRTSSGAAVASAPIETLSREVERSFSLRDFAEFLLVGGATIFLLPLLWLLGRSSLADAAEYRISFLAFYAAYIINDPHFAVTYVLFYRNAAQRALSDSFSVVQRVRYWVAGLIVPVALLSWCAWALAQDSTRDAARDLGFLFQLMYFLVSWHYAKQAFGILVTLCARRQVRFSLIERRLLLGHAIAAWFFARANPRDFGSDYLEQGVLFHSIPHPDWFWPLALAMFSASTVGLVVALFSFVKREGRLPPLGVFSAFLVSIWIWTIFTDLSPMLIYVIPGLHSVQYLYFVWLQRKNEARAFEGAPHFGRPAGTQIGLLVFWALALGWLLFHGLPESLDDLFSSKDEKAFGDLGPTPFLAAIFSFINIHHYFMDAVIWRREVPETRYLFDQERSDDGGLEAPAS